MISAERINGDDEDVSIHMTCSRKPKIKYSCDYVMYIQTYRQLICLHSFSEAILYIAVTIPVTQL